MENGCSTKNSSESPSLETPCFLNILQSLGQDHLVQHWPSLTESQRASLYAQINSLMPLDKICRDFQKATGSAENFDDLANKMHKIDDKFYKSATEIVSDEAEKFWNTAIGEGQVAVLLLAGGQGTRLGVAYPKGMYDVGLPSKKTLYQLQAERILRLQNLAKKLFPDSKPLITWYIMASEATRDHTEQFFEKYSYFGLNKSQIVFFEQGLMPCFTFDGKIILEACDRMAMAPDGNGGLYKALVKSKCLEDMERRGIKFLHTYCVDNILVKVADPMFVGYCIVKEADCGAKVVEKKSPDEPVGIICRIDDVGVRVVEYSEIPKTLSEAVDSNGKLLYRAGSIANHFFTTDFLRRICLEHQEDLIFHVAKKKIPYIDVDGSMIRPKEPNGIKLEKFVFDVFQFSEKFYVWEVAREEEFSPLKNGSGVDSPATCRDDVFRLHRKWVENAGGKFIFEHVEWDDEPEDMDGKRPPPPTPVECEISPLTSYRGEDLEELLKKKGTLLEFPIIL